MKFVNGHFAFLIQGVRRKYLERRKAGYKARGTRQKKSDKTFCFSFLFPKVAKRGFCYFFCDTKLKTSRKLCRLHKISLQANKLKFILVFYFRPILAFYGEYTNLVFLQEYLIMECVCLKIILYKIEC